MMELQRISILFCTLAVSVSRRAPENLSQEALCTSQCTGFSGPNLPAGSRFSYRYSTATHTLLQGRAYTKSGTSLESTAVVEVLAKCHRVLKLRDVQIKTTFESGEKLIKENGRLREALEQYPLLFCVHDGRILKIFPQESEPTWALNIKRGILSVLQTSSTTAGNSSVDESQQQLLSSNLECVQRFDETILAEAKCTEYHLIAPLATKGRGGVKTQTQTAMKLFRVEVDFSFERVDTKNIYESTLLYEQENTARWSREEEVAETLQRLCMKPSVNSESTDLFMTLVFELQHLTSDALMSLWRRTSIECKDNWQPLLDALPSCATEACVVLMKEMIVSGEVEEDKIESFFWSLSFIPEPTAGMIDVLASLLQLPSGRQSAFLGISSLVHHFCAVRNDCDQEPAVWGIMKILEGYLGRTCIVHESEENRQVELVLRAIGNAGLAAARLTPVLSSCAQLKSNPVGIRLAAVEAFRRIPCAANRTVLVHLYQTYNEDVEIRIASYLMAMNCPGGELFSQIKWTLQEEKSSQVGSFVWSHLSQLLETNDPLKQHLKNALPDEILSKEFDGETWKFSSYSDVTLHSAAASANVEGRLIFSPASFIPRTIATNLTIHVLGRAINLLELVVRLENMEDAVQKFFGFHPVQSTKARRSQPEPPLEMTRKTQRHKRASKRHSLGNHLPSKESKPKLRGGRQSCPNGHYSEMSELVKKFTKRMGKKKKPKCVLSIRIFGNELTIVDCGELRSQAKRYYLNLAELVVKLLKGQEVQFNKRLSLGREELLFPAISGLPVLLALNISAAVNVTIKGNMDFKQRNHFFINGYIKPSANLQISAQMGTVGMLGTSGLTWASGIRSSTGLDGGIQVKRGKEFKVFLNTPEDSMEMVYFSSQLYVMTVDGREPVDHFPGHVEMKSCTNEGVSKMFGWQLCSEISYPNEDTTGFFIFPFHGPIKVAMTLAKKDRSLHQYLLKAAYNYISQKGSWIPNEAGFHFFIGTPQSELKRDVAVDLYFNIPQKTFRIEFIQPMKKIQMNGKIEASRNSRVGHLEMILDDKDAYYVKVKTDLQTVSGEQRYTTQLEAKLRKSGSPIILSGNVTKQPGKKMALSISLINLLKDAAFLSVCLEKKNEDKLRQYSLEGETHIPGVLGSHVIGLLQQRGHLWSNALRVKYGLFGDAKNLQHECNMGQMLKVGNGPHDTYRLDLEHELYCTQILAYNHKVSLHHEESAPQLYSKLEVNYGKHWDEINNKRRVLISQTFKNNSYASLASYFMEFTVQVLEKQVDYRTQFQHTHSTMSYVESSTSFKVQYTNYMPFVAELQWKDMSRYHLKKWEGTFNMDTPWLYLYIAHKLQQPQRSAYLSTVEFTTGKALIVKGLVVEIFCKNKDNEKEARIRIHTPTTTYLRRGGNEENTQPIMKLAGSGADWSSGEVERDHKTLPVVLQLQAQIEEVRKEKMLYQKCGTLHFRHPFKLPIPQSFLLQETFTVNKKEKHYFLETKVLINGLEESVQTLTLGYEAENPHICAGLTHPYNSEIFPQNVDACATTRNLSSAKCEVEATLKINKKDVLSILGKYQNKSSGASSHHLGQVEMTHSFQAHATASCYGRNGLNGSFYLRSSGKDLVLLETSVNREVKKEARVLGVSVVLRQTVLTPFKYLGLQLMGKMLPSSVQHNIDGLKCILPQHFSLNGSLKRKKNIHEGIMKLIIDQSEYGLHLRNRNMFGNASLHNIIVALTQNGSQAFPSEAKLRGQLELHRGIQRGAASMQVDTGALCIDISNVISQEQMGVSGTLTHNISAFHMAGLPTENSITAVYGHLTNNHTVALKLEGGNQRITAAFGVEKLHLQAPRDHLRASFNHNIVELKNHGIPFTVECVCYYQVAAVLKDFKNVSMKVQYGSHWIDYSTKEAEGKVFIHMENEEFLVLTKLTFTDTNHTQVVQLMHTMPQLTILPRQLVLTTAFQKSRRTQVLRGTALWDGREVKFTGAYTGLSPKTSRGHDIKVEIHHPLSIPLPWHSTLKVHVEHSMRSHRDEVVVGWDSKEQIIVSSSLKIGKEHANYHAALSQPFNFTVKQIEVSSLTESRRGLYNQQLQSILTVGSLQACGTIEQTPVLFNQHLDMKWDGKKVKQNLTYEKGKPLPLDKIQWEALAENVFLTSCSSQHILGKVEMDYSTWLNYYTSLRLCDLPNAITLLGKHQLNKGDFLWQSEGKLSLADDEASISVALRNHSNTTVKNYAAEFAFKAPKAVSLDVTGSLMSSAAQSEIVVEGIIDPKEKVKLIASKGKECVQYYMGYLKGDSEDGLELAACTDGQQQAALHAHLVVNGAIQEEVGNLVLEATDQSLSLKAHGCGNPVIKIESKLNEIASTLQHRLLAKNKTLEESIRDFRKSVQHLEFLCEAAGWPLKAWQEIAGLLQSGTKGVAQMWKQSGLKPVLQDHLPLYLGKLQDIVQQMQNELQKPLTTLKEAYYDVTLKPLDEVWQQKTEEYLKKLQAFVPTIVKDVWLMEPIQVSLRILKIGLDMATQQMLSWAEAKLSRAVSKIQKPLSNLYSFSARNCSVAVRLPVLPRGEPTLDLAHVANYLIEEKLLKPLCGLYRINPAAEYYRFKRMMMESPFEHHALLIGNRHLRTFDGKMYSLTSQCSVLLAKDFVQDAFTIILNHDSNGASLHIEMNGTTVIIHLEKKSYKRYNYSLIENCQRFDMPPEANDIAVKRDPDRIVVSGANGVLFSCDLRYDLCTFTMDGWHHGVSAGLFGTNDNEAGNEWILPDHSYADSLPIFLHRWQVSSQCSQVKKTEKQCPSRTSTQICETFFQDSNSVFRNCFQVVDPDPFYHLCTVDMCALHHVKPACTLVAAFVHLCNRNFVPLEMPLQCV
ncbi:uncharacterized protein LOC128336575 [Hemicordylus capensis]|uniref:uncharacterized protein LOC128336575 n=1 Tax=Hemicordylus capensis TaxID=884348 RepID=UPI0023025FD3|nr:uncharacterized protein LOC128336575 [Hemicordylus capensis]